MKPFPDESSMPRSEDGTEVIRGCSVGFNRILDLWVKSAVHDRTPRVGAVLISAYTVFRNVWTSGKDWKMPDLERGFRNDVSMFCDYFDRYLSYTSMRSDMIRKVPVILYFPNYDAISKEIQREETGKNLEMIEMYHKFAKIHAQDKGVILRFDKCVCFMIKVGSGHLLPQVDLATKFNSIIQDQKSYYTRGDKIYLISHIPVDWYVANTLRNVAVLRSHQADVLEKKDFHFRLDKEGRLPFSNIPHVVFGDNALIKRAVTPKQKKDLLEIAVKERWILQNDTFISESIAKYLKIPVQIVRKFRVT